MDLLTSLVLLVVGLVNLGCFIYVLIKLFSAKGIVHGLFGIICSIYTFIWGWQNADEFQMRNIMIVWTVCVVIGLASNFLFASSF